MKYILLTTVLLSCTKHIHHKDMLTVKPGMTYAQVVEQIGLPNKLSATKPIQAKSGEFDTAQIYVWKSHENMNDWIRECYFSFLNETLIMIDCK